jgi:hypothetical protein
MQRDLFCLPKNWNVRGGHRADAETAETRGPRRIRRELYAIVRNLLTDLSRSKTVRRILVFGGRHYGQ